MAQNGVERLVFAVFAFGKGHEVGGVHRAAGRVIGAHDDDQLGGVGDGGNTIWLANSYWSDFNGEDERSWQASYALDFGGLGLPGLSWTTAYVRGDNIKTAETNNGKEHEWFNQVQYQVQDGPAKDLKFKVRYSVLRVSSNASDYNVSGNEVRVYVEYPFNAF